jgi:hypothetical protein
MCGRVASEMAATHGQPMIEEENWISVRGGLLRNEVAHLPVTAVHWGKKRLRLMNIRHRDTDLSKLLCGRPACERPLARVGVFRQLREAIDRAGYPPSAASAGDDDGGFKEDLGVEEDQTDHKRKGPRLRGVDFITIPVYTTPGEAEEATMDIVCENSNDISMDVGDHLENLCWLSRAVLAGRADNDVRCLLAPLDGGGA